MNNFVYIKFAVEYYRLSGRLHCDLYGITEATQGISYVGSQDMLDDRHLIGTIYWGCTKTFLYS